MSSILESILETLSSAWIPDLLLLALAIWVRLRSKSWLSPGAFFGLYWVGVITVSLLAMDHTVPGLGVWALVTLVMAVQMGSALAETGANRKTGTENNAVPGPAARRQLRNTGMEDTTIEKATIEDAMMQDAMMQDAMRSGLRKICLLLLIVACAGCVYFIWYSLDLFGQTLSVLSVVQIAAKWTVLRYAEYSDPWLLRLATIWMYPPALLAGVLSSVAAQRRDRLLGMSGILPALLLTFLSGGRAAFVLAFALWLGGRWAARVAVSARPATLFSKKAVLAFAALAAGLVLMFAVVNTFRGADAVSHPADLFLDFNSAQIRNYMFGTPAAFAEWFARGDNYATTWGALSFQGVFDILHIRPKTLGTYSDSERTVGAEGTNIFTMFRGLIQDFTFPGAVLACVLWGWWSGRAYARRSLASKDLLTLAAFYAVTLFGALICPFTFNSTIFAWACAWLALSRKSLGVWSSRPPAQGQPRLCPA